MSCRVVSCRVVSCRVGVSCRVRVCVCHNDNVFPTVKQNN